MILIEQSGCGLAVSSLFSTFLAFFGIFIGKWVILAGLIFASIIYLAGHFKEKHNKALLPLIFNVGVLIISLLLAVKGQDLQFALNKAAYHEVITLIEEGKIEMDERGRALLPPEYRHLSSCGGGIQVNLNDGIARVFFFHRTDRTEFWDGVWFEGLVYRSDNQLPQQADYFTEELLGIGEWNCEPKEASWFYCTNTVDF